MTTYRCRCACGNAEFSVNSRPLFRVICHCTICQCFNNADFADVLVFSASEVEQPVAETVRFDTYRPPPNVQRGKCTKCDAPAIESFETRLAPSLIMVPAEMFPLSTALPAPVAHIFYEKRVSDVQDELPKYKGYVRSQLAFGKHLIAAKLRGNKA